MVYPDPTIYDKCGNILDGGGGPSSTTSYPPNALSTQVTAVYGGRVVTRSFNFEDLPCGPPGIATQLSPGEPYHPTLDPPFKYAHAFLNDSTGKVRSVDCEIPGIKDPPKRADKAFKFTGPNDGCPGV